jgi:hypothetical protein
VTAELPTGDTSTDKLPPAGWYRDPLALSGVSWRWWDGRAWSNAFWQPPPPEPGTARPRPLRRVQIIRKVPDHGFHIFMMVITCGAWFPVWMWNAAETYRIKGGRRR